MVRSQALSLVDRECANSFFATASFCRWAINGCFVIQTRQSQFQVLLPPQPLPPLAALRDCLIRSHCAFNSAPVGFRVELGQMTAYPEGLSGQYKLRSRNPEATRPSCAKGEWRRSVRLDAGKGAKPAEQGINRMFSWVSSSAPRG